MRVLAFLAAVVLSLSLPARAGNEPPYLKLAQDLGTPALLEATEPKDKSRMLLHFGRQGEDVNSWTKMTTVAITQVPELDTQGAVRGVIHEFKDELKSNKATILEFEESPLPPLTAFFSFTGDGESHRGIIYSPAPGYVAVIQLGARQDGVIEDKDVALLRSLIVPLKPAAAAATSSP